MAWKCNTVAMRVQCKRDRFFLDIMPFMFFRPVIEVVCLAYCVQWEMQSDRIIENLRFHGYFDLGAFFWLGGYLGITEHILLRPNPIGDRNLAIGVLGYDIKTELVRLFEQKLPLWFPTSPSCVRRENS